MKKSTDARTARTVGWDSGSWRFRAVRRGFDWRLGAGGRLADERQAKAHPDDRFRDLTLEMHRGVAVTLEQNDGFGGGAIGAFLVEDFHQILKRYGSAAVVDVRRRLAGAEGDHQGVLKPLHLKLGGRQFNFQAGLQEQLDKAVGSDNGAKYFVFEEAAMYTSRESQMMQAYLQEHGKMPGGGSDELDDLF